MPSDVDIRGLFLCAGQMLSISDRADEAVSPYERPVYQ